MTVEAFGVAPLSRDRSTMVPLVCFNIASLSLLSVIRVSLIDVLTMRA